MEKKKKCIYCFNECDIFNDPVHDCYYEDYNQCRHMKHVREFNNIHKKL